MQDSTGKRLTEYILLSEQVLLHYTAEGISDNVKIREPLSNVYILTSSSSSSLGSCGWEKA